MLGTNWYFSLTRNYIALFGTLFRDISVVRYNTAGEVDELLHVPIGYAPKEKVLARLSDPDISRQDAVTLPRMSFEITDYVYDGSRRISPVGKRVIESPDSHTANATYKYVFNPTPWDIHFALHVFAHNSEDGLKIIEQILPFFTPDFTVTAQLIPEMEIDPNIQVVLNDVSMTDDYGGDFKQRRLLSWTLDFTLKGYYWGPIVSQPIIKFANVSLYIPSTATAAEGVGITQVSEKVTVQPGLTANGTPTSNAAESIPYSEINATDDFGFIVEILDGPGKGSVEDSAGDQSNTLPYQG